VKYRAVHANVHGIDSAVRVAAARADILHLNESHPDEDVLDQMSPEWGHRRAESNAIAWRTSLFNFEGQVWRREVLAAKPGRFGWQASEALAVVLEDRKTGHWVLHAVTHWPSQAFTVRPWRRKAWARAKRNTRLFIDTIQERNGLTDVPVLFSVDGNNGGTWHMLNLRTVAAPRTHGRGRYDRWLARGNVKTSGVDAFRTGSDHLAVAVDVETPS
jgi:hypothetical protein